MPSDRQRTVDPRMFDALVALNAAAAPFRAAIAGAADELSAFLVAQRVPQEERSVREAARLGSFAAGHVDVARFAELTGAAVPLDALRLGRLEQALEVLNGFLASGDELYHVHVPPGADLRDTLRYALASRGRVFHAARAVELLRTGSPLREPVGEVLEYRAWSRPQRAIAPPLVVEVNGADLQVGGIGEYLDGTQKIVLLVVGPAAPAPLARLIAPETFVMQTGSVADLRRVADFAGPAIVAVMPESCARFTHDPRAGSRAWQRLDVAHQPEPPRRAVAGGSLRQQLEELAWLAELAKPAAAAEPAAAEPDRPVEPADQLAAWLLSRTDLGES